MKKFNIPIFFMFVFLAQAMFFAPSRATAWEGTPVLKWQQDCPNWGCENAWYSSCAVGDLDFDGRPEVICADYSLTAFDGPSGEIKWQVDLDSRCWPGVILADLDNDGILDIAVGTGKGDVLVKTYSGGTHQTKWRKNPFGKEVRSLSAADLDGNGSLELVAGKAGSGTDNLTVYNSDGQVRPGWPQLSNESGYAWGIFNDTVAIGDMNKDGRVEIVAPSDCHYICAYTPDGVQVPAHAQYGGKGWGKVGVWEDPEPELRGWGECGGARIERYRTNFDDGPAVIADVDGNGTNEVVVTGNVYDCASGFPDGAAYTGVYIFNADRSRYKTAKYDWTTGPVDTGAPLTFDYNIIETCQPNPVVADLDSDGEKEILFSSNSGHVHAFWLDKTEHGNWPYKVTGDSKASWRFSSEPVVADLDGDGKAEVIFTTWPVKESGQTGQVIVLDYLGNRIFAIDLPSPNGWSENFNGALAAPTLANIDLDGDLELVVNTRVTGVVAYDLPNSALARVLWATGRGSYLRNGCPQRTEGLEPVRPMIWANGKSGTVDAGQGETVNLAIHLLPGSFAGKEADWWIVAASAGMWGYLPLGGPDLVPGYGPTFQGSVFYLPQVKAFTLNSLPVGDHHIWFGVDLRKNGVLDADCLYYDDVTIHVAQ